MFRTPFPAPGTRWGTRLARIIATLAFSVAVTQAQAVQGDVTLADGAPDHYVVVKGDTLWGIAGKFIKEPWRWPEIWHLNKGTIHNPNRIYPGDMVLLVRGADGRLQLKVAHPYKGNRSGTVKLEPKEYTEKEADEIPAIPPKDIEPYLTRPLVVDNKSMDDSGRIVAPQENRVNLGAGDKAYVTNVRSDGENWEIYRPGKALVDPDTKEVLGYEAFHLGTARLVRPGDPALMTAFNSKSGGFHLTTVGRVQTPTLSLVVARERKIREFKARPYWEVEATFGAAAGEYLGKWFDTGFKGKAEDEHARADRVWDEAKANALQAKCQGKPGTVTEEAKPSTQLSPLLYDLTSLQREANSRFGFSAKSTLGLAQALYEKHKVLTYPRTDARALPEDYLATVRTTLEMLKGDNGAKGTESFVADRYGVFAGQILKGGWVVPNKRIFNNAKISDHFAIIPTTQAPKHLSEPEQKLYDMVFLLWISTWEQLRWKEY